MTDLNKTYDVIVVGSGVGGSMAVKELTDQGMDVLLLEAGRDLTKEDFVPPTKPGKFALGPSLAPRIKAMLSGQHVQSLRAVYAEGSNKFLVNDRQNPYTMPFKNRFLWIRGRVLGGRLNTYGRVLMRMSDTDFKAFSNDGQGADWPFSYEDIRPYYDKVEKFVEVIGLQEGVAAIPDGVPTYEAFNTDVEKGFKAYVEANFPDRKVISWRYASPNLGRTPKGVAAALATGKLTLRTDSVVSKIRMNNTTGLAEGVEFIDRLTKQVYVANAKAVMLCASGIESVRLLLNSADEKHPTGLGNSHDLVGRYFMDQVPSVSMLKISKYKGFQPDTVTPSDPYYGTTGGIFIPRFRNINGNKTDEHYRGFAFQGAMGRFNTGEGDDAPSTGGLMGFGEMLPYYDNRITLSKRFKDAWGIPVPHLDCSIRDNERRLSRAQLKAIREMAEGFGAEIQFSGTVTGLDKGKQMPDANPFSRMVFKLGFPLSLSIGASIHECGGARMGTSPENSVTNVHGQVWEAPNVVVTDGSVFASGGTVGPSLTIMALSTRGAEFVATTLKGKGF